jgi:hypothetical protein
VEVDFSEARKRRTELDNDKYLIDTIAK